MMRITDGKIILVVSRSAYDEIYKGVGFYAVDESVADPQAPSELIQPITEPSTFTAEEPDVEEPQDEDEDEDDDEDEDEEDSLEETPLSELSFDELKRLAEKKGIDTAGMRSKRDLRLAIKQIQA